MGAASGMNRTRTLRTLITSCAVVLALASTASARQTDPTKWEAYLDYAYMYSSADSKALGQRLVQYGREAGLTLEEYLYEAYESVREVEQEVADRETADRRLVEPVTLLADRLVGLELAPDGSFEIIASMKEQPGKSGSKRTARPSSACRSRSLGT